MLAIPRPGASGFHTRSNRIFLNLSWASFRSSTYWARSMVSWRLMGLCNLTSAQMSYRNPFRNGPLKMGLGTPLNTAANISKESRYSATDPSCFNDINLSVGSPSLARLKRCSRAARNSLQLANSPCASTYWNQPNARPSKHIDAANTLSFSATSFIEKYCSARNS